MGVLELLKIVQKTPGAISMTEAFGVFDTIMNNLKCSVGIAVDLGSNAGKSSLIGTSALSALNRMDVFHCVDPVYDLNNEKEWANTFQKTADNMPWGICRELDFKKNLLNKLQSVSSLHHTLYGETSLTYLKTPRSFSYVFLDSDDHQLELIMQEVKMLMEQVMVDGLLFFHDFMGNYVAPGMAYEYLVDTGYYEPVHINWDKAIEFVNKYNLEEDNDSWHFKHLENPNFAGCLKRIK